VWPFVCVGSVCGICINYSPLPLPFSVPINGNVSPPPRRPSQTPHTDSPSPSSFSPPLGRSCGPIYYPRAAEIVVAVAGTARDRWATNAAIHIVQYYSTIVLAAIANWDVWCWSPRSGMSGRLSAILKHSLGEGLKCIRTFVPVPVVVHSSVADCKAQHTART